MFLQSTELLNVNSREMLPFTITKIKDYVSEKLNKLAEIRHCELKPEGLFEKVSDLDFLMASFLEGLFIFQFDERVKIDFVPADADLKLAFADVCNGISAAFSPSFEIDIRRMIENFNPRIEETIRVLHNDFDGVPGLCDIAPEHRWRLLINPLKIDMLGEFGLNTNNSLLAFLYEIEPGYAYETASGWIRAMENLDSPVDVGFLSRLFSYENESISPGRTISYRALCNSAGVISYGALCSANGKRTLARNINGFVENFGARIYVRINKRIYLVVPSDALHGGVFRCVHDSNSDLWPPEVKATIKVDQSLENLLAMEESASEYQTFYVARIEGSGLCSESALEEILNRYYFSLRNANTADERIMLAIEAMLQGLQFHAFQDKNYRRWCGYFLNRVLLQNGEKMCILHDYCTSAGSSLEQLFLQVRNGQRLCEQWKVASSFVEN